MHLDDVFVVRGDVLLSQRGLEWQLQHVVLYAADLTFGQQTVYGEHLTGDDYADAWHPIQADLNVVYHRNRTVPGRLVGGLLVLVDLHVDNATDRSVNVVTIDVGTGAGQVVIVRNAEAIACRRVRRLVGSNGRKRGGERRNQKTEIAPSVGGLTWHTENLAACGHLEFGRSSAGKESKQFKSCVESCGFVDKLVFENVSRLNTTPFLKTAKQIQALTLRGLFASAGENYSFRRISCSWM